MSKNAGVNIGIVKIWSLKIIPISTISVIVKLSFKLSHYDYDNVMQSL